MLGISRWIARGVVGQATRVCVRNVQHCRVSSLINCLEASVISLESCIPRVVISLSKLTQFSEGKINSRYLNGEVI